MKGCVHSPECGGCRFGDVSYAEQIAEKQAAFTHQLPASVRDTIQPIIVSQRTEYHRNKMEYSFFLGDDGRVQLGLKRAGRFDQCVPTRDCRLFDPRWSLVWDVIVDTVNRVGWSPYNPKTHVGLLRYLVVRRSEFQDKWLINWVVADDVSEQLQPIAVNLRAQFPWVGGVVMSIQSSISDTAFSHDVRVLDGESTLLEAIDRWIFRVSPYSFFQTHSSQAAVLYRVAKTLADPKMDERMLDLYCGAGTIGIYFSDSVRSVLGVEENPSAIQDGIHNCAYNSVSTMQVTQGKVKNILKFERPEAELIVVDPPRSGLEPKALRRAAAVGASRIVYVSCNPKTLGIDLPMLEAEGYVASVIQPVDMFPHSNHLEAVALLVKSR
ncbi:23S rRNA (uracil(1939)-C(5))-methyltransferase RlmD [bacterium]|nr:23S rRNA (uracil(1939)-C(5))-methyltransferase RlmD [bacterium]